MRTSRLISTLLLCSSCLALPAMAATSALPVAAGQSAEGTWTPGAPVRYALALRAGDLVQGSLQGPAGSLDLVDAAGRHVRRLLGPTSLARSFMFVAPSGGAFALVADGGGASVPGAVGDVPRPGARYALRIDTITPRSAQQAPADAPDSPTIAELARTLAAGGTTEAFWRRIGAEGAPLIEPMPTPPGAEPMTRVTFLWRGARHNVRLLGSPSGDHDALERLGNSDVWYRTYLVPSSTRMSYQLAPEVPEIDATPMQRRRALLATLQRDPLNPHTFAATGADAYQQKSVLELPGAPPQPWIAPRAGVPRGTVTPYRVESRILAEGRDIYVYRPAGKAPTAMVVLFDAHAYLSVVPTPTILDNLIADGLIPPVAALFVANPSAAARGTQLPGNPKFADFLADELMPWAATLGLSAPAARTVITGSSYGGLAAAYAGLRHPERFGLVLSQSGSFWWAPGASPDRPPVEGGWLMREYASAPRVPLRFYLEAGRFEDGRGAVNILTTTRHMRDVLVARGYPVTHAEFASGHDYLQWRGTLACGLIDLLGDGTRSAEVGAACPVKSRG